jgi:chromosome segregation ATPase
MKINQFNEKLDELRSIVQNWPASYEELPTDCGDFATDLDILAEKVSEIRKLIEEAV